MRIVAPNHRLLATRRGKFIGRIACLWLSICSIAVGFSCFGTPVVLITNVPAFGTFGNLQGRVLGADPATQALAVFINVPPYGWYSKPTCAQALTAIQPDGSWSVNVTTASSDTNTTRFAVLLVNTNYNQSCVLGLPALPTNDYAQAIAKAVFTRPSPGVRFLSFSGYDWWVKNFDTPVGPGPNYFSDNTSNVWTDPQGWLHLRITHRTNQWQCAEIVSARTFGCGSYRFELGSRVDNLDTNVVLGMFTWSDDPAYTDREMDVECSRGFAADTNNTQFTVQPYAPPTHYSRYHVPAGLADSTHLFLWQSNLVAFQCQAGSYSPDPNQTNVISAWTFADASAVPQSGDENVRINLWLLFGHPPGDGQEVELILKSFQFVPLSGPQAARLNHPRLSAAGLFQCDFTVQPDFRYAVQIAPDLIQWTNVTTFLATNDSLNFADANVPSAGARCYRVVTLP